MKILCLPYTHTLSHISRPLAVAIELKNRGHEVIFAGESTKVDFIKSDGFTVIPLYEPNPEMLYGNIRRGKLRFVSDSEIEQMVKSDTSLLRDVQPDLVLSDGRFSAPISTSLCNVKHCAIVNVSSTEYRALPYVPFFDWMSREGRQGLLRRGLIGVNLALEMFIFDNFMSIFKRLTKKHGLKKHVTATNCLTGKDMTLLADITEYFPARNLPDDYHYIGPLTWKPNFSIPSWWPPTGLVGELVYITMGTTGLSEFFPKIHDLFKSAEYSAILTTGAQNTGLENIAGKFYVEEFIDGDMAMELCVLVVCHGGNGTIYQALQHGKPIIGIPTIPDQKFNMRRVEALGLGKSLSWEDFSKSPKLLLDAIDSIISDKTFSHNAETFRQKLSTYNSAQIAADLIEIDFAQ